MIDDIDNESDEPKCHTCGATLIATTGPLCAWCIQAWSLGEAHGVGLMRERLERIEKRVRRLHDWISMGHDDGARCACCENIRVEVEAIIGELR